MKPETLIGIAIALALLLGGAAFMIGQWNADGDPRSTGPDEFPISYGWPTDAGHSSRRASIRTTGPGTGELLWEAQLGPISGIAVASDFGASRAWVGGSDGLFVLSLSDGSTRMMTDAVRGHDVDIVTDAYSAWATTGVNHAYRLEYQALGGGDRLVVLDERAFNASSISPPGMVTGLELGDDSGAIRLLSHLNGSRSWTVTTNASIVATPLVYDDTVFVGNLGGAVHALRAGAGAPVWTRDLGAPIHAPASTDGRNLFVATMSGNLHALALDTGETVWAADVGSAIQGPVAYVQGAVYGTTHRGDVFALSSGTGEALWTSDLGGAVSNHFAAADSTLYVAAGNGLVAIERTSGDEVWRAELDVDITGPVVAAEGKVLVATADGVRAYDAS